MRCGIPAGMTISAWAGTAAGRAVISAVSSPSVTTTRRSLSRLAGMPGSSGPVRSTAVTRAARAPAGSSVSSHRVFMAGRLGCQARAASDVRRGRG